MHGRGSPLAPTRCISVALGFEPRESVSNLETWVKFPVLNRIEPLTLTKCNAVALGFKP